MDEAKGHAGLGRATSAEAGRLIFLDHIRSLVIVLVVAYHSVAAYATVAPHFPYHDASFPAADLIRELLDVAMMPVLFFIAGYFAPASLDRKGLAGFLGDKGRRLLIPWLLAVGVVMPLLLYGRADPPVRPFWAYWLWYLGSFETGLSFLPSTRSSQAVYWFLSLLFVCFVAFAVAEAAARRRGTGAPPKQASGKPGVVALVLVGVLTAIASFVGLLLFPDTSWFTLDIVLQFEPTRLVLLAGYFAFGAVAGRRGWFAAGEPPGSPLPWALSSAGLAAVYLALGQTAFADPAGTPHLPAAYLLAFAFVRSFLVLSLLVALLTGAARYWNRSGAIGRQLSATSYNIYLTHFWFVVILQESLIAWTGGPSPVKAAIVFLAALGLSFAISRWVIGRYPRSFTAALLALFAVALALRA